MKLESLSATLRLRQPWEAMDLGVALLRHHGVAVYRAWFAVVLPLFVVLHLLCFQVPWLVPWLLWWLKPLLDRVVLYVLSRTLFGQQPSVRQVLRALPGEWWRDGFAALTLRRLSPSRSFYLPVSQLEQLRGRERRARLRVLGRRDGTRALGLTLICLHLEIILALGLMALVAMLLPDFVLENAIEALLDAPHLQQVLLSLAALGALSVMEPCYVACGFALYLNRRTWLEAWDLEIGFRQLARRLGTLATVLLLLGSSITPSQADDAPVAVSDYCQQQDAQRQALAESPDALKNTLARVLEEEPFQRCRQVGGWEFVSDEDPSPEVEAPAPAWVTDVAALVEGLLWLLLGVVLILLGRWLYQQPWRLSRRLSRQRPAASVVIHGETLHAEDLDPQAAQRAWQLWQQGEHREALGLLYRASLRVLLAAGVRLGQATTEAECLHHAEGQISREAHAYLQRLTQGWQSLAYAHRPPKGEEMAQLCRGWSQELLPLATPPTPAPQTP